MDWVEIGSSTSTVTDVAASIPTTRNRPCSACPAQCPYCTGRCVYNYTPQAACLFGICSSSQFSSSCSCSSCSANLNNNQYCDSSPSTVTGTTITVKFYTDSDWTASGFFAVVTGDATVTAEDETGESGVGKCIIK